MFLLVFMYRVIMCFFDFHEIRESPKKMEYPVTDFRVAGHVAQSELLKPQSWRMLVCVKNRGHHQGCPWGIVEDKRQLVDDELWVWIWTGWDCGQRRRCLVEYWLSIWGGHEINIKGCSVIKRKTRGVSHWSDHKCRVKHASLLNEIKGVFVLTEMKTNTVTSDFKTQKAGEITKFFLSWNGNEESLWWHWFPLCHH